MPDSDREDEDDSEFTELVPEKGEPELPPFSPPNTKSSVNFNQQVNVYQQIPPTAWDRLSPSQVVALSKAIISQIDIADKRQFDYALEQTKQEVSGKKMAILFGSLITIAGYGISAYLALHGQLVIASSISAPITAIVALVVGKRFLD